MPSELERQTIDQLLILILPREAIGAAVNRTRKVSFEQAAAMGADISQVFGKRTKVRELLEARKGKVRTADGRNVSKQQHREELRRRIEERRRTIESN